MWFWGAGGAITVGIAGKTDGRGDVVYSQRHDWSGMPQWGEAGERLDKWDGRRVGVSYETIFLVRNGTLAESGHIERLLGDKPTITGN